MAAVIDLSGHTALVTGGSRNIGRGIALALAGAGADVAVLARRDKERLDEVVGTARGYGVRAHGLLVDVGDWDALEAGLREVGEALGTADIVVNNVGIRPQMVLEDITADDWDRVFNVNVRAAFQCIRWALPRMLEGGWGRVVNVSGQDALAGSYGRVPVTASKGALLGLTAAVAPGCAPHGVTVNTLVPGTIDTHRHTPEWYPNTEKLLASAGERTLLGRLGTIEEVAGVALFLASDLSSFLTGQTICAGGGYPLVRRPEMEEALRLR